METMIFLDTHVVAWLYTNQLKTLSKKALDYINQGELYISEIVKLELQYLYEIGRINKKHETIISSLDKDIGLNFSPNKYSQIINQTIKMDFTRDPFDRIIVADASLRDSILISKDRRIIDNYHRAVC